MDPTTPPKPAKDANASAYYKAQHNENVAPVPVTIRPARFKHLKIAGIFALVGLVFTILAVVTNIAGLLFEIASLLSFIASFVFFVIWSLRTVDKSLSTK